MCGVDTFRLPLSSILSDSGAGFELRVTGSEK
jgi:hypothetical protein